MIRSIAFAGAALLAASFVLSYVPLIPGPSQTLTTARPDAAFNATTVGSLTGYWDLGLSWSTNQSVSLEVVLCRSINSSAASFQTLCSAGARMVFHGTSGSGTFAVPIGGVLLVGIVSSPANGLQVTVQLKPTSPLVGTILLIGGAGAVTVGVLRRKSVRPPRGPPAAPRGRDGPSG